MKIGNQEKLTIINIELKIIETLLSKSTGITR
jgi:hypothetical protein